MSPSDVPDCGLCFKHVHQLNQLRKETNCSWPVVVSWLRQLLPFPVEESTNWARNIQQQWEKKQTGILVKRSNAIKNISTAPEQLKEWEGTRYFLPTIKGPRPVKKAQPISKFNFDIVNEENAKLKQTVAELNGRPSPHKQANQKRRETSHKNIIQVQREQLKSLSKVSTKMEEKLETTQTAKRKIGSELRSVKAKCTRLEKKEMKEHDDYVCELENENAELIQKIHGLEEELKQCKEANSILLDAAVLWRGKLAAAENEELILMEKGAFTSNTRKCVYELLGCHISQEKIPNVIQSVLKLAQKKFDRVPKASSVRQMNKEMVCVAQAHLQTIADAKNLNLQSDETPKYGECYEAFICNDNEHNSYLLGMRHMADKSAQTTFDTLKEILTDLNETCNQIFDKQNIGFKILTKITSTMTDRAATETKFHHLVETYRKECLPHYYQDWDKFSPEAQTQLSKLYQFFCGLHLMVGIADTVNATIRDLETVEKNENSGTDCEEKSLGESEVVRCVRVVCKALSRGGDAKSGKQKEWRTHCDSINHSEYASMLQTFKGNRFNVIFLLGGNLYFLYEHALQCLEEVTDPNKLIKISIQLLKNKFNKAGCRALGILRKFIMMPLWRLTEQKGHIVEMNKVYADLVTFCSGDTNTVLKLLRGEIMPFTTDLVEQDVVTTSVTRPDDNDPLTAKILQATLIAIKRYVEKTVKEHLPGGAYFDPDEGMKEMTKSAPRHNKNPERVFGLLDFMVHKRPNSSALANEAVLMYVYNHTSDFINALDSTQLNKLIFSVKKRTKEVVQLYKTREKEIKRRHLQVKKERQQQQQQRRAKQLKRKTDLTDKIVNEGLWQTDDDVEKYLNRQDVVLSETDKQNALTWQIKFRQEVLCQHHKEKSMFTIYKQVETAGKKREVKKKSVELKEQLLELIHAAQCVDTSECISTQEKEKENIPFLAGKRVSHVFKDGAVYTGKVIGSVPGFPSWYNIVYDGEDEHVYTYRLVDDYKDGNLEILIEA